jgi:thiol:disulfide interchange protein
MSETGHSSGSKVMGLLHRHRSSLVWAAVVGLIVWIQWPMIRGSFYRFLSIPAPADGIAWRTDLPAALDESKQTGRPVLLDFSASWCPPCQVMKHEVWPDQQVRLAIEAAYIPVFMDVDAPASQEVARRYNVRAVPTILVVAADGRVLRETGFLPKDAMLTFLKSPA